MLHELKTHPQPFQAVWDGRKAFEVRVNDRPFAVDDDLKLREYDPETGEYSGRIVFVRVSYLLPGGKYGLPETVCVMSLIEPIRSDQGKHVPWERGERR